MRRVMVFLALMSMLATAASAATTCKEKCERPKATAGTPQVVLDANSGKLIDGSLRLPQTNNVEVVFVNKNPFRHRYRFDIRTTPLEEGISISFLSQIADFPQAVTGLPSAASAGCPQAANQITAFDNALIAAEAATVKVKAEIDPRKEAAKKYNAFLDETDTDPIQCEKVCKAAEDLAPELKKLTDLGTLPTLAETLAKAVADTKAKLATVEQIIAAIPDAGDRDDCINGIAPLKVRLATVEKASTDATDSVKEWKDNANDFKELAEIIANLDERSFVESRNIITSGATLATVEIGVRDLDKEDSPERVYTAQIQVGESRISVSGGIGFSTIEDVTLVRQKATVNDTLVDVFAEENASSFKPNPVAMLNATIGGPFTFPGFKNAPALFSWSLGLVLASRNDDTQTEYVTGPSIGFIDNHVIFTFGYHAARVSKLGGNFKIGDKIPDGLTDIPVTKKWDGGFMFAVTYRFR